MSLTISQVGQPASISITPGAGVAFGGTGAAGLGYVAAAVGPDGQLQMIRSDGVTQAIGKVARVVTRIAAAGAGQADGAPLASEVSIVVAGIAGGCCVLPSGLNLERKVINQTGLPLLVFPGPGAGIDLNAVNLPVSIPAGEFVTFHTPDSLEWASA